MPSRHASLALVCTGVTLCLLVLYGRVDTDLANRFASGITYMSSNDGNSNITAGNDVIKQNDVIVIKRRMTSEDEFKERRDRIQQACAANDIPGGTGGIFTAPQSGLLYCFIPKTGCTFWKLFFLAVRNNKPLTIDSIFGISRVKAHTLPGAYGVKYNTTTHSIENYPHRFMVVRDPFSRLISSFLDKAYLPDHWGSWTMMIARIARRKWADEPGDFLRDHYDKLAARFVPGFIYRNHSTYGDTTCAKFITFSQWVKAGMIHEESHYAPLHTQCNPCKINVTHVNYLHSFDPDARALLSTMNLDTLMDDPHWNHSTQMDQEMSLILDYNFEVFRGRKSLQKCLTLPELALRLWHNFQWKGYIHPEVEFTPLESDNFTLVKQDLTNRLQQARILGLKEPELMKEAKTSFKRKAFLSLGPKAIQDVLENFKYDFKLFDFEKERKAFFKLIS